MKKESGKVIYSPGDLIRYPASPFASAPCPLFLALDYDYEQEQESCIPSSFVLRHSSFFPACRPTVSPA